MYLDKKEVDLSFLAERLEKKKSVITFEDEEDFNYGVMDCRSTTVETASTASISILIRTNIVVTATKITKKCRRPPKSSITSVLSLRCIKKKKCGRSSKAEISQKL